jgi:hypothetical protein
MVQVADLTKAEGSRLKAKVKAGWLWVMVLAFSLQPLAFLHAQPQ